MSKLRENISSIIALLWNVAAILIFVMLIRQGDKNIADTVKNIVILILGYYFGSTRTMNEKIKNDMNKENPKSIN